MPINLPYRSATEIAGQIRDGELSPVTVVDTFLGRIKNRNPEINAFVTVCGDRAREEAQRAEVAIQNGDTLGPLHGVPVAIKDLNRVEGVRTTFGSNMFADFIPDESDTVVQRLEDAGAIILGKTNTPEFGRKTVTDNPVFGASGNPWDPSKTTGGSSGGSAAAVADGLVPIALGSDAAGSLRIPASACGVVGFVPDFGRTPLGPVRDDAYLNLQPYTFNGPMARTVEDVALMLSVIAGPDVADPYSVPEPVPAYTDPDEDILDGSKIAFTPDFGICSMTDEVVDIVRDAVNAFTDVGATVNEVDTVFEESWETLHDALNVLLQTRYVGMYDAYREQLGVDLLDVDYEITSEVLSRIEKGLDLTVLDYQRANRVRTAAYDAVQSVLHEYDFLVAPTLAVPPFDKETLPSEINGEPVDPMHGWILTWPINLTGNPTLAMPAGFTDKDLPVGLQLVGPHHCDASVLAAGRAYESVNSWAGAYPPR